MKDRYTFQVTTPEGEVLGSLKCDAHLSEKFLGIMYQEIKNRIRTYKDLLSAFTGAGEKQKAILREYKGLRDSINEILDQVEQN